MRLLLLSGTNPKLSRAECHQLGFDEIESEERLIISGKEKGFERLALTKSSFKLLFSCSYQELQKKIEEYDFESCYRGSFRAERIRIEKTNLNMPSEKTLAEMIWHRLSVPRIDLSRPKTTFTFIFAKKVYCCTDRWDNNEEFDMRRPHLRPYNMPISLHPRIARALVNLSGASRCLLDPFCGTGGILIEAGLMGIRPIGVDIDKRMIRISEENMKRYNINNYKLILDDSTRRLYRCKSIATDLPYGKNTRSKDIRKLYDEFFASLKRSFKGNCVVSIIKGSYRPTIKVEDSFEVYIHRSMTKNILLIKI